MRKFSKAVKLVFTLIAICGFIDFAFSQKLSEPKLVGTWSGGEDFGEFIFHKTEELNYYLKENPNGKIIARLCSKDKMSLALVSSIGFAFNFPWYADGQKVPSENVFFARYSKCNDKTEQYWFAPENTSIDYDEIILAKKVGVTRLLGDNYEKPNSAEAKKDFAKNTKQFIEELKNNSKAQGFVIRNLKTKSNYFQQASKQIQKEKIDKSRIRFIRKNSYETNFPEFMIVTVDE